MLELRKIDVQVEAGPNESLVAQLKVRSTLRDMVLEAQQKDLEVCKIREKVRSGIETSFQIQKDGMVVLRRRMYLPDDQMLKREVLQEAHESRLATHPGSTKMYRDLKDLYWWPNMKKEVAEYVAKFGVCQQVKVEHQKPIGFLQPLLIPVWKWESIMMDFVSGLPRGKKGSDAIWVIMDRLTKSALFLAMKMIDSVEKLEKLYVDEVVRLHNVPVSIVSYRDPKFTSRLWPSV